MKLRTDELDRERDALDEREILIEKGQKAFQARVDARLGDKEVQVAVQLENAKDGIVKEYMEKLAKAEARYLA